MTVSSGVATQPTRARGHGFHPLRVRRIVRETPDTVSVVLDVPAELADAFTYRAGQFLTFRLLIDGEPILRSYSMSSAPEVGDDLAVTVKRVDGGVVSNWFNDTLAEGDVLESTRPAGHFCLDGSAGDLVGFAGGSGMTPIYSLTKAALETTSRRVRLLYANRDRESVIFDNDLAQLMERYPDRLQVAHHLDCDGGFVDEAGLREFLGDFDGAGDASYYICGPGPFMDLVEGTLRGGGVDEQRIHIERFSPLPEPVEESEDTAAPSTTEVTIELGGETKTGSHRPGTTILQTARQLGLKPPYSCEAGDCATCMAKLVAGSANMKVNNALFEDEVADGYVLTCQAVPDAPSVHVVYED
jgi:3-ketosteroid 9alpha-monooxygenase subunit B